VNPRLEARERVGDRYEVRVLEPSPPAVTHEPFSDDPTARGDGAADRTVVAPYDTGVAGDLTWDVLARDDRELAEWCAVRALGAWSPPPPLPEPDVLVRTRLAWHSLAEHVLCAARYRVNGKIGLRFTRRGFGTPFFGADEQVRVEGTKIVHTEGERDTPFSVTTLGAAASAIGVEAGAPDLFEPATPLDLDRPLELDAAAVTALAWWYGFSAAVMAQLRADAASNPAGSPPPSLVQLWPEHFDLATDLGDTDGGRRANYGASPGDAEHPEPYLYVGPWDHDRLEHQDPYWNESFGSSLPYAALAASANARDTALDFFRSGHGRLARGG
jgi:hypothetical protein